MTDGIEIRFIVGKMGVCNKNTTEKTSGSGVGLHAKE